MSSMNYKDGNYVGEVVNGLPHGKGKLTKSNYDYFVGMFRNGEFINGKARITFEDKSVYVGGIANGKPHGKGMIYRYGQNSCTYKGEFKNGLPHGIGKMSMGYECCTGEFRNGEFINGKIKYVVYNKNCYFKGNIINKKPNGNGVFEENINGYRLYKGELRNGLPHGRGTMKIGYDRCVGEFRNGEFVNGTAKMDLAKVRTFFEDKTNIDVVSKFTHKKFPALTAEQEAITYKNGDLIRKS